ncbi:MAG: LysR family transcriptional regulator [Phormidesmis sp.]
MVGKPAKSLQEKVKLSQMRALVSVAETGSFSEAAVALSVSQSTISHSIAALEDALGVILIHRGRQSASLTPVGATIYKQAQSVLSLVNDMGQEANQARGIKGGLVRIAAFRSLASEVLPSAIAHLHQHYPTIQVTITEFESNQGIMTALTEGKADLSLASLLASDTFETSQIMEDPFIALLPPNRPDLPTQLTWQHLREQPLITSSSDCCKELIAHLQAAQPPVEIDYLISNDSTAVSMTRQGLGMSLMPKLAAQPIPQQVRVARLPFNMVRPLGLSWLKNTLLTPATYAFLETFRPTVSASQRDASPRDASPRDGSHHDAAHHDAAQREVA